MEIYARSKQLVYRDSKIAGVGVFAAEPIDPGELIQAAPVVVAPPEGMQRWVSPATYAYANLHTGEWGLPGGCFMFLNHAGSPNAIYSVDFDERIAFLLAAACINPGDEITIDYQYGGDAPDWWRERR